jgi:8-oxo-dGTP diphosphatase
MTVLVCVSGRLVREQSILLEHRRCDRAWYPDVWDIPGGHVEPEETEMGALVRELREELGIEVTGLSSRPLGVLEGDDFRLTHWAVKSWSGSPVNRAVDEHDAISWVKATELEGLSLAHPLYAELVRDVLSDRKFDGKKRTWD